MTTMRLSDAIRKGAKLRPHSAGVGKGDFSFNENREICSCAMGAAYEAAELTKVIDEGKPWPSQIGWISNYDSLLRVWPVLNIAVPLPVPPCNECDMMCGGNPALVVRIITHINDCHGWTREQIADWVKSIEVTLCL